MTSSAHHQKPFTFDGFAEEIAKTTSTSYTKTAVDQFSSQRQPAPIGSQKSSTARRPPPGFEQKVLDGGNNGLTGHDNNSTKPDVVSDWYQPSPPSNQSQPHQRDPNPLSTNDELPSIFMKGQLNHRPKSTSEGWTSHSKTVGDRKGSRNSSGNRKDNFDNLGEDERNHFMQSMNNMFAMPGPYGDSSPRGNESPSNPLFLRTPHSSGGSNNSFGNNPQAMQQLMAMLQQNAAMSHLFAPMNPMMGMMNMNPAMVHSMMNMMSCMNQFSHQSQKMQHFMQTFEKFANSGQFPPNMETFLSQFNKKSGDSPTRNKNSMENNSSNVNSSSPNSSFDSDSKVKMSPRTQERLTNVYDEINSTPKLIERLNLELDVNGVDVNIPKRARYFIIKSFTEEDVHRAVKYKMWCSTYYGNRRLESAYDSMKKSYGDDGDIVLFFSVNASGHFCGVAKMTSRYDPEAKEGADVWCRDEHNEGGKNSKWRGMFSIQWMYIKDIPNTDFTHLRVTKNGGKPFPHSRDTQEIETNVAESAIKIFHDYKQKTSLLDDFDHYNRMEERQHMKERAKSYKYLNENQRKDNHRTRSSGSMQTHHGGGRRGSHPRAHERPTQPIMVPQPSSSIEAQSIGESTIKGVVTDELPVKRLGGARNPEYESDAILNNSPEKSPGQMFEDLPGVLSKLKPDSVTKILAASGSKNVHNGTKYVPVDEQINSSQSIEKVSRKVPGQPGPNAIPIVKPKDHDSSKSKSESSTPEKAVKETTKLCESVKDIMIAEQTTATTVNKSDSATAKDEAKKDDPIRAVKDKKDDEINDDKKDELNDKMSD